MVGNPYQWRFSCSIGKYGGGTDESYYSRGNLKRLREWVATVDGDLLTVGLFIPFEAAWESR